MDFYGPSLHLPNPDPVLRKLGKDESVYRAILSDAWVCGCMRVRKAGVRSRRWEIDRGKTKTKRTREVERILKDLDVRRIISSILKAVPFGFQPLEILWQRAGSLIVPSDIVARPRTWFLFDADNRLRFRSKLNDPVGELLPERKFLVAQHEPSYENPYGDPVLSSCFWPATFKKAGFKFLITFAEKYGMTWLIGKVPHGSPQEIVEAMIENLEAMVQDAIAVIQENYSVEVLSVQDDGIAESYLALIKKCQADISIATLGYDFDGGSKLQRIVKNNIIDSDARTVEEVMNKLIGWICELNWCDHAARPSFSLIKQQDDIGLLQARVDLILTKLGMKFTKKYFMRTYGFETDDIECVRSSSSIISQ